MSKRISQALVKEKKYFIRGLAGRCLRTVYQGKGTQNECLVEKFLCYQGPSFLEGTVIALPVEEIRVVGRFVSLIEEANR